MKCAWCPWSTMTETCGFQNIIVSIHLLRVPVLKHEGDIPDTYFRIYVRQIRCSTKWVKTCRYLIQSTWGVSWITLMERFLKMSLNLFSMLFSPFLVNSFFVAFIRKPNLLDWYLFLPTSILKHIAFLFNLFISMW